MSTPLILDKAPEREKLNDRDWLESLSYQELMEHFRYARDDNRFHNGALGKHFSELMDRKRAEVGAEEAARIDAIVLCYTKFGRN